MRKGCPAIEAKRLGAYWTTSIGGKSVVVFKSDSHMSQDGPQLPNIDVWHQIIDEVQPKLVLTTGTAGGIGKQFEVGDVIVSPIVRFDCTAKFKQRAVRAGALHQCRRRRRRHFADGAHRSSRRMPRSCRRTIRGRRRSFASPRKRARILGRHDRFLRLRHLGRPLSSFKGLAMSRRWAMRCSAWSCSEMASTGAALARDPQRLRSADQGRRPDAQAAGGDRGQIYKGFGRWSSVCSAITCWASIAAE